MTTSPPSDPTPAPKFARRAVLQGSLAAGLLAALPRASAATSYASDEPEVKDVRFGIIAVESCASIVVAHEKGFFKKHGLASTVAKEASWAGARDKLASGENHATHMKYAQPIGSTLGVLGAQKFGMVIPFTLSRNGSVFMVAKQLEGKLTADPKTWKTQADELKAKGEVLTIALPLPFGWHGLMYRHFLASGGVNADKDLKVITLPPAQMVQNMRVGTMHACALVEPWGTRGVGDKITTIALYGHELWRDHPVKALGVTAEFADKNPKTVKAMVRALHEAAAWCDDFGNREELARMLSTPSYLNSPAATILPSLKGDLDWGDGRKQSDQSAAIAFSKDNHPQAREIQWFAAQFRRWGMVTGEPDYADVVKRVARADLYEAALKELGATPHARNDAPIRLWDGTVFDPAKPAEYGRAFAIHNRKD
ncbi:MAG: ABC transporter substrate-binding protein [Planctomycetes bacterium]|nr:ABC transporter substrate-binding protein [Planctomycetota bacterium]